MFTAWGDPFASMFLASTAVQAAGEEDEEDGWEDEEVEEETDEDAGGSWMFHTADAWRRTSVGGHVAESNTAPGEAGEDGEDDEDDEDEEDEEDEPQGWEATDTSGGVSRITHPSQTPKTDTVDVSLPAAVAASAPTSAPMSASASISVALATVVAPVAPPVAPAAAALTWPARWSIQRVTPTLPAIMTCVASDSRVLFGPGPYGVGTEVGVKTMEARSSSTAFMMTRPRKRYTFFARLVALEAESSPSHMSLEQYGTNTARCS